MIVDFQIPPNCITESGPPRFSTFVDGAVVRRAGVVALILGSVLTLVNQADALLGGSRLQVLPLVSAYMTPFVVAAISQALGLRQAFQEKCQRRPARFQRNTFLRTALSHGIPARALLLALAIGTANTTIFVGAAVSNRGDFSAGPIGQGFILPLVFGLLSQAAAYRRATSGFTPPLTSKGPSHDDIIPK